MKLMIIDKNEIEAALLKAENLGGALFCGVTDLLGVSSTQIQFPYT
ncbi:hypothetical protein QT353_07915 [Lentilactobacillus buchneri]|nr:hypothetical protein [Lentilactobacillus buchneri]